MKTNILVLAAGHVGFSTGDNGYPLCLIEADGVALIERIVGNAADVPNAVFTFALRDEDIRLYHLDRSVGLLAPGARIVRVADGTRGSACTMLLAAAQFAPDEEVLIVSANEWVDMNFAEIVAYFRGRRLEGGALTFRSVHPRYSYVRLSEEGLVCEAAQQTPISQHATAGLFYFARAGEAVEAIKDMIRKDASIKGEFYVCPAFNELSLKQRRVGILPLDAKRYRPLKSARQVEQFEAQA
jgi:hypothetical protein